MQIQGPHRRQAGTYKGLSACSCYSAFALGFASDSAFIAFFKDMIGITPGHWRK